MAAYRRTHSPSQLAWSEGWQPLGTEFHYEPCDDRTRNAACALVQFIIITMGYRLSGYYYYYYY